MSPGRLARGHANSAFRHADDGSGHEWAELFYQLAMNSSTSIAGISSKRYVVGSLHWKPGHEMRLVHLKEPVELGETLPQKVCFLPGKAAADWTPGAENRAFRHLG